MGISNISYKYGRALYFYKSFHALVKLFNKSKINKGGKILGVLEKNKARLEI